MKLYTKVCRQELIITNLNKADEQVQKFYDNSAIMEVVTKGNALRKEPKQCELITRKPSRNCTTAVRTNLGSLINHDSNGNAK